MTLIINNADVAKVLTMDMTLLTLAFRRKVGLPLLRPFVGPVLLFGGAAGVMGAAALPLLRWLTPYCAGLSQGNAVALVSTLLLCAALYFSLCLALGRREPRSILASMNPMRRREGGTAVPP